MMEIANKIVGTLKMDVASEGNYLRAGQTVIVEQVRDNFNNLLVRVIGMGCTVRLDFYDTDIPSLVEPELQ